MDKLYKNSETGCCPRFDPKPWDEKEIKWKDKPFIQDKVRSFFHIPLNMGQVVVKNMTKMEQAKALPNVPLMLVDEKSMWGSEVYIAVTKEVPEAKMVKMSGTFLTKVFEGSYSDTGKWIKEMQGFVDLKKKKLKKLYFSYTTCPKCAKYYGKNYVVLFAQV